MSCRSLFSVMVGAALLLVAGAIHAGDFKKPAVPDALKVPAEEDLVFFANAKGVQIYECQPKKDDPAQYEWVFKAPEADLFDMQGKKVGHHYAGPTWEWNDGSKVVGEVKAKAPSSGASAVPLLLLTAKSHEGSGVLSSVTSIQRLETVGGQALAPAKDYIGKTLSVPYTAVYYFYAPKH